MNEYVIAIALLVILAYLIVNTYCYSCARYPQRTKYSWMPFGGILALLLIGKRGTFDD